MKGSYIRTSLLVTTAALTITSFWGCTQKDDIVTTVNRSELTLEPQSLPTPPNGMVYELWISNETVADTNFDLSLATSLGRFSYISNDTVSTFLDVDGNPRSAVFDLTGDFQSFHSIFVGLQLTTDQPRTRPGAIMLIAYIPAGLDIPTRMVFPQSDSLWQATSRFNMEGISDRNRRLNDGHGLWFSSYRWTVTTITDTLALSIDSTRLDTLRPIVTCCPSDTSNLDSLKKEYLYSVDSIRTDTIRLVFPLDTLMLDVDSLMHIRTDYHPIYKADLTYPYVKRRLGFNYTLSDISVVFDIFTQDQFGWPVVSEWGWSYCGWVASPNLPLNGTLGKITYPAWRTKDYYFNWLPGSDSAVIPTGLFSRVDAPNDSGNPYALGTYLPPMAGTDFLNSTALQAKFGVSSVNFLPNATGNTGTVFVSMEPKNRLVSNTNFPLIAFLGRIPSSIDSLSDANVATISSAQVNMLNSTSQLLGNEVLTFPVVAVKVKRY